MDIVKKFRIGKKSLSDNKWSLFEYNHLPLHVGKRGFQRMSVSQ